VRRVGVGIAVEMTEMEIVIVIVIVIVMSGIVEQFRDAQIRALDDEWVLDLSYAVYRASPHDEHPSTRAEYKTEHDYGYQQTLRIHNERTTHKKRVERPRRLTDQAKNPTRCSLASSDLVLADYHPASCLYSCSCSCWR
jgi:hypothetical protein